MSERTAFPGMVQLDAYVYFYQPATFSQGNDGGPPQLIVLCTWMSAKPAHVIHYINGYQALDLHASGEHPPDTQQPFGLRVPRAREQRSKSALAAVRSTYSSTSQNPRPRILFHIFSNGGSLQAVTLLGSYHRATG